MGKRHVLGVLGGAALGACAGGASSAPAPVPDWRGPAVHCRHGEGRGLVVELIAPTAGHSFTLQRVDRRDSLAQVHCIHRGPTADFVAQVLTPLQLVVAADQLGDCQAVAVFVTGQDGIERLAIATARP